MGKLSTHILDTASGKPGGDIRVTVDRLSPNPASIADFRTNADGRADQPIMEGEGFVAGVYQLTFYVADYFATQNQTVDDPPFLGEVVIKVGLANPNQHYHVPLLISPYGYSTYRGS